MWCVVQVCTSGPSRQPYRCEVVGGFVSQDDAIQYVSAGGYLATLMRADARLMLEVNGDWWFVVEEAHYAESV